MEALSWVPADTETVTAVPVPAAGHPGAGRCSVWVARGAVMAADTVTVAAAMMAARALRGDIGVAPAGGPTAAGYGLVGAAALPLWVVAFSRYRLYQASRLADRRSELGGLVHGVALGVALTALAAYGLGQFVSQGWLGLLFVLALIGVAAEREVVRRVFDRLHRNGRGLRPVAVVGTGHEGSGLVAMLEAEPRLGYKVVAMVGRQTPFGPHVAAEVPVLAHDDALVDRLRAVGAGGVLIAVTDVGTDVANRLVRTLPDAGLHVELSSSLQDIDAGRLSVRPLGHRPVLHVEPVRRGGGRAAAKRTFDLAASLAGLLVALPVLVAAALAVKATSPGPVLYRQVRVGRHGRPFTILKLRSMYVDSDWRLGDLVADASRGPVVKLFADPRVTRVGRI
ncbi:MAG: sugar transferase, partial [Acidimicrobiales bacterium]